MGKAKQLVMQPRFRSRVERDRSKYNRRDEVNFDEDYADKYTVGARIRFKDPEVEGVVVENVKLTGDICIQWETYSKGVIHSYDEQFLDDNAEMIE